MSQQGESPIENADDWWGQLYDDATGDTGPASAADSLDDRFASAVGTVADRGTGAGAEEPLPPAGAGTSPPGNGTAIPALPRADTSAPPAGPTGSSRLVAPLDWGDPSARGLAPWEPPSARSPGRLTFPSPSRPAALEAGPARALGDGDVPAAAAYAEVRPARTGTVPPVDYVGSGPPTYDPEPTALPLADPDDLGDLVADTVLDGARYGACTLRAVSVRGDSARYRGEPRRDALLTARFGTGDQALVLVAMATGARAAPGAHLAAAEVCHWIGRAVGRSHLRLSEDIRADRRGDLKSGLQRLTDRSFGKLRADAVERSLDPEEYTATLRCLLLPADPSCRTRVFFGVGPGGLFRLRDGEWQDIEPHGTEAAGEVVMGFGSLPSETPEGDRITMDLALTTSPSPYEAAPEPPHDPFRFRASIARPGDTLLLCSGGLAGPLRGEPLLAEHLTERWSAGGPPGLAAFLADTAVRVKGYADDRTAAAVWEA